jgi:hypothetical protein
MSSVAILPVQSSAARSLGPAEVVSIAQGSLGVRLASGAVVPARIALAQAYDASVGDEVLVIGEAGDHYVIGVLLAKAPAVLAVPGDLEIRAGGALRLTAGAEVEITGREVAMRASKLSVLADAVTETFTSLRQRVREVLSVHAGESHTIVEGSSFAQSKSATIQTEKKVSINGREIFLG